MDFDDVLDLLAEFGKRIVMFVLAFTLVFILPLANFVLGSHHPEVANTVTDVLLVMAFGVPLIALMVQGIRKQLGHR